MTEQEHILVSDLTRVRLAKTMLHVHADEETAGSIRNELALESRVGSERP